MVSERLKTNVKPDCTSEMTTSSCGNLIGTRPSKEQHSCLGNNVINICLVIVLGRKKGCISVCASCNAIQIVGKVDIVFLTSLSRCPHSYINEKSLILYHCQRLLVLMSILILLNKVA